MAAGMRELLSPLVLLSVLVQGQHHHQRWGKISTESTIKHPVEVYRDYWTPSGSCQLNQDPERVVTFTPSTTKKAGHLWNKKAVGMADWEVILEFSVSGPNPVSTGEGLAFWHVGSPGSEGTVYGHSDSFDGLGVFFDSYDADGDGKGETYVLAMINDGTQPIEAEGAGKQLGVCFTEYRNLPHMARAKITYESRGQKLTVTMDVDNSGKFKPCLSVKDVPLKKDEQYFGLSVSDYASDFTVRSLIGIDTASRYNDEHGSKAQEAFLPEDSDEESDTDGHGLDHAHIHQVLQMLSNVDSKLFELEDDFGKLFAKSFSDQNRHIQHYISDLLHLDLNNKFVSVSDRAKELSRSMDNMQHILGSMKDKLSGGATHGSGAAQVDNILTQVKSSCITDGGRGQDMVSALKESVATLKVRQEEVLNEVHSDITAISGNAEEVCNGGGTLGLLLQLGSGVVVGYAVTAVAKYKRDKMF